MTKRQILGSLITAALAAGLAAQGRDAGLVTFRQALLDASVDTRVVIVATHPDDQYRGLSLLLRRRWGCDVTVLVATRGEGGQNAIGPELGAELGKIRTREAVAAAQQVLDVKLRFLDLPDFGYSRTAAEALDRWRADRPFERLAQAVDELHPDLLIAPHAPGEAHGQKRAVLHLLRRYVRARGSAGPRFFRKAGAGEQPAVALDLDRPDPERGRTYREEAFRALQLHRTQQPHRPLPEAIDSPLQLKSEGETPALLAGLPDVWRYETLLAGWLEAAGESSSVAELRKLSESLPQVPKSRRLLQDYDPTTLSIDLLGVLQKLHGAAPAGSDVARRLRRRMRALERAILAGAVVRLQWDGESELDPASGPLAIPLRVWNGGPWQVQVRVLGLASDGTARLRLVDGGGDTLAERAVSVPRHSQRTLPLFLALDGDELPRAELDVALELEVRVGQARVTARVSRRFEPVRPLTIRAVPEPRFLVPARGGVIRLQLELEKPAGAQIDALLSRAAPLSVRLLPESERDSMPIRVRLPVGARRQRVPIRLQLDGWVANGSAMRPHSRTVNFYLARHGDAPLADASCTVRIDPVQIRVPAGLRIGIVRGPDNTIEEALASLGLDVRVLEPRTLARANLDDFDTILIDSRALLRRAQDLRPQVQRFVAYARRGRHLVVLYHKEQEFNADQTGVLLAPFPLRLGTQRVTREDAPVSPRRPEHPLLTRPNRIEPRDWDGWIQERGLYFPEHGAYDERYVEVITIQEPSMAELPDVEAPERSLEFEAQRGALLAADAGSGSYVYCALVLHRQLEIYHPGAARLLVNLVTPPSWPESRFR